MVEAKDLSVKELKAFHKATRKRIECAKDSPSENEFTPFLSPGFNRVKAEGQIVLRMLDEEFEKRGYDVTKLFKKYNPSK